MSSISPKELKLVGGREGHSERAVSTQRKEQAVRQGVLRPGRMAQRGEGLPCKPVSLNSVSRSHVKVEGERQADNNIDGFQTVHAWVFCLDVCHAVSVEDRRGRQIPGTRVRDD